MPADLSQTASNLGVAGFAILVLWWMYQSAAKERQRNDERLDKKDEAFRNLEREVRTEISAQLVAATSTIKESVEFMRQLSSSRKRK